METENVSHSTVLRVIDPAEVPCPSEVVASLGLSSQLLSIRLQSFFVRASHREQTDVIVETVMSTMKDPRASPADLSETTASADSICSPQEAGSSICTFR